RINPRLTPTQVNDDVTAAFRASYAGDDREWKAPDVTARSIAFNGIGRERPEAPIARWLAGVAVLLVLIAAANVANLLVIRAMRRRHEIAVRLALGIGRIRLARLLMLESLAYSMLGAAAGIACAFGGGTLMRRVFPPSIAWTTPTVNVQVVVLSVALALLVGAVVGLAPIAQVLATDLAGALRDATSDGLHGSRLWRTLLAVQIGFSVILLVGAGLFVRSLSNVEHLDLGVQPNRVLVASVGWPRAGNISPEQAAAEKERQVNSWRELRELIARLPGVDHAALAVGSPFGNEFGVDVRVPGRDTLPSAPGGGPYVNAVDADYFSTAGTPLIRGRAFGQNEGAQTERVAIVNQTMASLVWPTDDALGKCIIVDDAPCATVVGIAHDARRSGINEPPAMQYYLPFGQESGFGGTVLLVRPHAAPSDFVQTLRRAIVAAAPEANVVNVTSMQERVDPQIRPWRLGATMFELFGGLALLVAGVGLYGAIAYSVAQRTREFGIRIAVGSDAGGLMLRVVYEGVRAASVGIVFGAGAALIAGRRLAPLLFRVSPYDPGVFTVVAALLLCCAVIACVVPAWRAARTDPVVALRS
ncbi:MAG TPA: FtsX-like permease family protein, partial [Gemmatimonadaceae bacterium]